MTEFHFTTRLVRNKPEAIKVIKNVSQWLRDTGKEVSEWWDPEKVNSKFFEPYVKDNEFYVVQVEQGRTAGAVIVQEEQNLQDWSAVDGDGEQKALYIHYLSVERDYAKHGIPETVVHIVGQMASSKGINLIRLDTNADQPKLREVYDKLGFKEVKVLKEGDHRTVLYQLEV